jgi:hypothetical protein
MEMTDELLAVQRELERLPCRILPTSFDADDAALAGFPVPAGRRWDGCERMFAHWHPHGVMMRLPLFWQVEVLVWYAARHAGAPVFLNDPENMPLGAAALREGGMDTVVAEARDAAMFAQYLDAEERIRPRYWAVVHRAQDAWDVPAALRHEHLFQEVHALPGLPVLTQCVSLAAAGEPRFHEADGLAYDWRARTFRTPEAGPIPSFLLPLPPAAAGAACGCGKTIYQRSL